MRRATIEVTLTMLTPIDEPERGWCPPCALPSLLSWHLAIEANGQLLNERLTRLTVCTECGAEAWA